jgi:hypothetical protein
MQLVQQVQQVSVVLVAELMVKQVGRVVQDLS